MKNSTDQKSWEGNNFFNHLLFYLISFGFFINAYVMATGRDSIIFYFCFSTIWLVCAAINDVFLKNKFKSFMATVIIMANTFIIPFSLYSYGCTVGMAALGSILYIIVTIALSPLYVNIAAASAGIYFSFIQKRYYVQDDYNSANFFYIMAAYISLIFIALCWRFLIQKLYVLINNAINSVQNFQPDEVSIAKKQYNDLMNNQRLLKEEIALHITELNDITGHQRNLADQ